MAFLDQKERILDIALTDLGRELLAKNQLNFNYYCFSDEGIDYSGSLLASSSLGVSLDNYIHRELSFEADQRKNADLKSFLYTVDHGRNVLPEFVVSVDISSSVTLERKFYIDTVVLQNRPNVTVQKPVDVIVRATIPKITLSERTQEYVNNQKKKIALALLGKDENGE